MILQFDLHAHEDRFEFEFAEDRSVRVEDHAAGSIVKYEYEYHDVLYKAAPASDISNRATRAQRRRS